MPQLRKNVEEIYKMAEENPIEVYKKYFAEDAVTIDLDMSETKGVETHIAAMQKWMEGVIAMNKSELCDVVVSGDENDGTVISIWNYDFETKEMGKMVYKQASVAKWKDGKVVREQFFGDMGQ